LTRGNDADGDGIRHAVIASDTEAMDAFIARAVEVVKEFGASPERLYEIRLIITEIVANAYLHGNRRDAAKCIRIAWSIDAERFFLRVQDEGEGFDFGCLPDPRRPENLGLDHGRGLFLVRLMASELTFHGPGNDVEVVKKLDPKE